MQQITQYINGRFTGNPGAEIKTVVNPADRRQTVAQVEFATSAELAAAVAAAQNAFAGWREEPVVKRCRLLIKWKTLIEEEFDRVTKILVAENGKTLAEAAGDLRRGLETLEYACGMGELMKGEYLEDMARNVSGTLYREPLGVVAGITPFNFPAMIPLWMIPTALAAGNTFVLKTSEQCPATMHYLAALFDRCGFPPGVLNIVNGDKHLAQQLLQTPQIAAVSFVGSTPAAQQVYQTCTANHKRVQAFGGAKNRMIILPDADPESTLEGIISSSFGCAGERCMATSVLILVGDAKQLLPELCRQAGALRLGSGLDPATELPPLISEAHRERVIAAIGQAVAEDARILLDGRDAAASHPYGNFLGATILAQNNAESELVQTEIFGPVLTVMEASSLAEAVTLANRSKYGNGCSLFTRDGGAAEYFRKHIECGMIGINAGVPAPMAFLSFGGRKQSFFGDLRIQGRDGIEFYTQKKSVITRWPDLKSGSIWGK